MGPKEEEERKFRSHLSELRPKISALTRSLNSLQALHVPAYFRRGGQLESTELLIVEDSDIVNGNNKHENANNENSKSRNPEREESLSNSSSDGSSKESGS